MDDTVIIALIVGGAVIAAIVMRYAIEWWRSR